MYQKSTQVIRAISPINYDYATIRITQSRIDKGLIAIPTDISNFFPDHNDTIQVYLDDSPISQIKHYSSYNSSTRECRIGGVREWFQKHQMKNGDEIVIQFLDKEHFVYRLISEKNFLLKTKELQTTFDASENEPEASENISIISKWTNVSENKVFLHEYYRLINFPFNKDRQYSKKNSASMKESTQSNLRILLENIYKGHCQICDFWFLKKDKRPYFEIHHLDPLKSHHPKNLLVICGNCHNQIEYANVKKELNDDNWLIKVYFNEKIYLVKQLEIITKKEAFFKELFI